MLGVLIGVVVVAIIIYVGVLVYQQRIRQQVAALTTKKETMVAIPLADEVNLVGQLSLTGQSLEQYQQLQADFTDIT